jgi:hypothetical protein
LLLFLRFFVKARLFFWRNSHIDYLMVHGIIAGDQCFLDPGTQTSHETTLLLRIGVHILSCILGQMIKFAHVL